MIRDVHRPGDPLERIAAAGVTVVLATGFTVGPGLLLAGLLALALIPVWWEALSRFRTVGVLTAMVVAAAVGGLVLTALSTTQVIRFDVAERMALLCNLAVTVGWLLWSRLQIGPPWLAVWFGVGLVGGIVLGPISDVNAWRFSYSLPLTVLLLALAALPRTVIPQIAVAMVLVGAGVLNDARSNSAMLALAVAVVAWQRIGAARASARARRAGQLLRLAVLGVALYYVVQAVILEGAFGEATRARTEAQIEASGSLLLGGRPEIAASTALLLRNPWGIGPGTIVSNADIMAAKTAMTGIGYDPDNGYVNRYMFGGGLEVHSTLADLWLWFGIPGLLSALVLAVIVARGLEHALRHRTVSVLVVFLACRFAWDLLFSPASSAMELLPLTVALLAIPRDRPDTDVSATPPQRRPRRSDEQETQHGAAGRTMQREAGSDRE